MNTWASYWLGKIYLFGCEEVPQNREKALQFLTFSAERGNGYAQNILDNMEQYQSEMLTNTIFSLFVNLSRCLSEDYTQKFQSGRISVDAGEKTGTWHEGRTHANTGAVLLSAICPVS